MLTRFFQVKGVKGVSVLFLHQPCDIPVACVVDDLHCLYLGVTKTLLHLWFDKNNSRHLFYIGNKVCPRSVHEITILKCPDATSRQYVFCPDKKKF